MLSVKDITVRFADRALFDQVSFLVNSNDRIGLVGRNGAGKSTLLKIIAREQTADSGRVDQPKNFVIGYLPQEMEHAEDAKVADEAAEAFAEVNKIQQEIDDITKQLGERTDYESDAYSQLILRLNDLNDRINLLDGYNTGEKVEKVLFGLGFEPKDLERPMREFSGGWKMRVELAKVLLKQPDLVLLDEPTNHLDIESIQWLEDFLQEYRGAILMISHDRTFLDRITNRTIEISLGKTYDYKFSYSKYVVVREEERERQQQAAKNQEKYVKQTEQLINKFRAKKNKAAFAQGLIRKLDKLERIEVEGVDSSKMNISFPPCPASGKIVLTAKDLEKSYGDLQLFKDVEFIVARGERVALIGKNGTGKTTMSKIIIGKESHTGTLEPGHNVRIGYYAQNQSDLLDMNKTVLATIEDEMTPAMQINPRTLLGSFLFTGDDVEKKVKVLSGGEKARLAFAKLLLKPCNVLVLDEPTNHLDMRSKTVLKQALMNYEGTLILVSHDRDFLDGLTDRIYEFRRGNIGFHHGGVMEFLADRKIGSLKQMSAKEKKEKAEPKKGKSNHQADYRARKERDKALRKLSNHVGKCEREIASAEEELKEVEAALLLPENIDGAKQAPLLNRYREAQDRVDRWMADWEKSELELTRLQAEKDAEG